MKGTTLLNLIGNHNSLEGTSYFIPLYFELCILLLSLFTHTKFLYIAQKEQSCAEFVPPCSYFHGLYDPRQLHT